MSELAIDPRSLVGWATVSVSATEDPRQMALQAGPLHGSGMDAYGVPEPGAAGPEGRLRAQWRQLEAALSVPQADTNRIGRIIDLFFGGTAPGAALPEVLSIHRQLQDDPHSAPISLAVAGIAADSFAKQVAGSPSFLKPETLEGDIAGAIPGGLFGWRFGGWAGAILGAAIGGLAASAYVAWLSPHTG